jgi:hypothetical protein
MYVEPEGVVIGVSASAFTTVNEVTLCGDPPVDVVVVGLLFSVTTGKPSLRTTRSWSAGEEKALRVVSRVGSVVRRQERDSGVEVVARDRDISRLVSSMLPYKMPSRSRPALPAETPRRNVTPRTCSFGCYARRSDPSKWFLRAATIRLHDSHPNKRRSHRRVWHRSKR